MDFPRKKKFFGGAKKEKKRKSRKSRFIEKRKKEKKGRKESSVEGEEERKEKSLEKHPVYYSPSFDRSKSLLTEVGETMESPGCSRVRCVRPLVLVTLVVVSGRALIWLPFIWWLEGYHGCAARDRPSGPDRILFQCARMSGETTRRSRKDTRIPIFLLFPGNWSYVATATSAITIKMLTAEPGIAPYQKALQT